MILIEFNGLPGCGKSTLSDALVKELKNESINVCSYDDIHEKMPRKPWKAFAYVLRKWKRREVINLYKISRCVKHATLKERILRIITAEQICVNYREFVNKDGICIIDQGLIQAIASILFTHKVTDQEKVIGLTNKTVAEYADSLKYVNAIAAEDIAKDRIRIRNFDRGSRLNSVTDDDKLCSLLECQLSNLKILRSAIQSCGACQLDIDMNAEINENTELLMGWIKTNVCA